MHGISATVVVNAEEHSMLRHMIDHRGSDTSPLMRTYIWRINSYRFLSHIVWLSSGNLDDRSISPIWFPLLLEIKNNTLFQAELALGTHWLVRVCRLNFLQDVFFTESWCILVSTMGDLILIQYQWLTGALNGSTRGEYERYSSHVMYQQVSTIWFWTRKNEAGLAGLVWDDGWCLL